METTFQNLDGLEALLEGLDKAEIRPVTVETAIGSYDASNNYVAVWNTSRNGLETIVERKNSTLIQHKDAFGAFCRGIRQAGLGMSGTVKNQGGQVIVEAIFDNHDVDDGSVGGLGLGVRLENNYDYRGYPNFIGDGFCIRRVCTNGMVMRSIVSRMFSKHGKVSELDKVMLEFLGKVLNSSDLIKSTITKAKTETFENEDDLKEVLLGELRTQKLAQKVLELIEREDTLTKYTVYNAITQYATHDAATEKQAMRLQRVAQRVLVRPVATLSREHWEG